MPSSPDPFLSLDAFLPPARRAAFLAHVPVNREVVRAWEEL